MIKNTKINIGSKNKVKIDALKETLKNYKFFGAAEVFSLKADSQAANQPMALEETIKGAKARAENAFVDCDFSFGIEDGLMRVPETKTGWMNVCVCDVYDGKNHYLGFSSAFEYPKKIINLVFREGLDINQAFYEVGLTKNPKIGSAEGAISILTKDRWRRSDTVKQAITAALIALENSEWYESV